MTFIWFIVWLIKNHPTFLFGFDNSWGIALIICIIIDVLVAIRD